MAFVQIATEPTTAAMAHDISYPAKPDERPMSPARAELDSFYAAQQTSPSPTRPVSSAPPPRRTWSRIIHGLATPNQLGFLAVVTVEAVVVTAMVGIIFARISANVLRETNGLRSIQCYLALFILGALFELLATLDALRLKNIVQVCSIIVFAVAMLIYASLMRSQIQSAIATANGGLRCTSTGPNLDCFTDGQRPLFSAVSPFAIVAPVMLGVAVLFLSALAWRLWKEYGWAAFKTLGASLQIRRMYWTYQVYVCLLKLGGFFYTGFCVQFLILVLNQQDAEFGLTIAAIPIMLLWLVFSAIVIRVESRWGSWIVFFGSILGLAYFLFKLVRLFQPSAADLGYVIARKSLAVFSIISIILLIATFAFSIRCYLNFGRGLKEALPRYKDGRARKTDSVAPVSPGKNGGPAEGKLEQQATRMSLD